MINLFRSIFGALGKAIRGICVVLDALGEMAGYLFWAAIGLFILVLMAGVLWTALS